MRDESRADIKDGMILVISIIAIGLYVGVPEPGIFATGFGTILLTLLAGLNGPDSWHNRLVVLGFCGFFFGLSGLW